MTFTDSFLQKVLEVYIITSYSILVVLYSNFLTFLQNWARLHNSSNLPKDYDLRIYIDKFYPAKKKRTVRSHL